MSRIYRLTPDGRKWAPAKQDGSFVLASPSAGAEKHHAVNKILVSDEDEAIALLRKGYSIRIETDTSPSLVRRNLYANDVKLS